MKLQILASVVLAIACTGLGLVTGMVATRSSASGAAAPEDEQGHDHSKLSEATLRNLGVTVAPAAKSRFVTSREVAASVVDGPFAELPQHAPIGGRVAEILVKPGMVVAAGAPLVKLTRDPLPRPRLELTADILVPSRESLHGAVGEVRRAHAEVEIARTELARIEQFAAAAAPGDPPVVPRQRAIDLRNQLLRAQTGLTQAREELEKHGLTEQQVQGVIDGAPLPPVVQAMWLRALQHNGLWPDSAQRLHGALPANLRELPWSIATAGELAGAGLATEELAAWLEGEPAAAEHFLAIGAMLQQGSSLAELRRLYAAGAFAPIVTVVAPAGEDFDVHDLGVKLGQHVEAGAELVTLRDPRAMYLRVQPLGGEVAVLLEAIARGAQCSAEPLLAGTGPKFDALRIGWLDGDAGADGAYAMVAVANTPLAGDVAHGRTWQLRPGQRYRLLIPSQALDDVYVLPATALVRQGDKQMVILKDGDDYAPVEVLVVHRDEQVVVLATGEGLEPHPGDQIVQTGAHALSLALQGSDAAAHHHHH